MDNHNESHLVESALGITIFIFSLIMLLQHMKAMNQIQATLYQPGNNLKLYQLNQYQYEDQIQLSGGELIASLYGPREYDIYIQGRLIKKEDKIEEMIPYIDSDMNYFKHYECNADGIRFIIIE